MSNVLKEVPVELGEIVKGTCESLGSKGDGIFKIKGFVIFVAGVEVGEECNIKITKLLDNVGFAEKVAFIKDIKDTEDFGEEDGQETQN